MARKPSKKHLVGAAIAVTAASLLVALPFRVYEYLCLMKESTGFFDSGSYAYVYGFYAFLAAVCVAVLCLCCVGSKTHTLERPKGKNIPLFIASFIFSLSLFVDAGYESYSFYRSLTSTGEALIMSEVSNAIVTWMLLVQGIFAAVSGVFFILILPGYLGKRTVSDRCLKWFSVAPILWEAVRIMIRFMNTVSFAGVSELLLELFLISFSMLFFCAFVKLLFGYELTRAQFKLYGYGLAAVLLGAVCSIPRYILLIFSASSKLYSQGSLFEVCDLFVCIFILTFLFSLMESSREKKLVGEEYLQE